MRSQFSFAFTQVGCVLAGFGFLPKQFRLKVSNIFHQLAEKTKDTRARE
jgi:hypothetical protein